MDYDDCSCGRKNLKAKQEEQAERGGGTRAEERKRKKETV